MKRRIYLASALVWMGVIFYMSNQPAVVSSNQSGEIIKILSNLPIIGNVVNYMVEIDVAQFIIRKCAHMFSYCMLAVLWFMAIYDESKRVRNVVLISFAISVIYACTDEFHQLFIPGRSGEIRDVMVDSIGAMIGLFIVVLVKKFIRQNQLLSIS